jgi:hypothetical protein
MQATQDDSDDSPRHPLSELTPVAKLIWQPDARGVKPLPPIFSSGRIRFPEIGQGIILNTQQVMGYT